MGDTDHLTEVENSILAILGILNLAVTQSEGPEGSGHKHNDRDKEKLTSPERTLHRWVAFCSLTGASL
jgi:hypothetical protein